MYESECSEQEIRLIEADFIKKENSVVPYGYNQTINTEHPLNDSNVYKKMSQTKRDKAKKVIAFSLEDESIIGIYNSIVDCAESLSLDEKKIAACCRGERHSSDNKQFYWLDDNEEIIVPIYSRDPYKGKEGTTQVQSSSKRVAKIDLVTNEILQIYDTIALAARDNNCDASAISKVCNKKRSKCGGFKWMYYLEGEINE